MGEPWVGWGQPDRPCDHGGVMVRNEGRNLPGRHFCSAEGDPYDNVHVGVSAATTRSTSFEPTRLRPTGTSTWAS